MGVGANQEFLCPRGWLVFFRFSGKPFEAGGERSLTAERVAFLVTGFHLVANPETVQTAAGWLARGQFRSVAPFAPLTCAAAF